MGVWTHICVHCNSWKLQLSRSWHFSTKKINTQTGRECNLYMSGKCSWERQGETFKCYIPNIPKQSTWNDLKRERPIISETIFKSKKKIISRRKTWSVPPSTQWQFHLPGIPTKLKSTQGYTKKCSRALESRLAFETKHHQVIPKFVECK